MNGIGGSPGVTQRWGEGEREVEGRIAGLRKGRIGLEMGIVFVTPRKRDSGSDS